MASLRLILAILSAMPAAAQTGDGLKPLTPRERELNRQSFELVWTTVRDQHWDPKLNGVNWKSARWRTLPRIQRAKNMDEVRAALRRMLDSLGQSHFSILPAEVYREIDLSEPGGGQPPVASPGGGPAAASEKRQEECVTGIEPGMVDGQAMVVRVRPGSPAQKAGVRPGWILEKVDGVVMRSTGDVIGAAEIQEKERYQVAAIEAWLQGPLDKEVEVDLLDGTLQRRTLRLPRMRPEGRLAGFGHLPAERVWLESRRLPYEVGYVRLNVFLDPEEVMPRFEKAVRECLPCKGFIIDLRGNPGGIGGMSMGMAGWFFRRGGQRLGTMRSRFLTEDFEIHPRPETFTGNVAVLVDGRSASTAEILAAGLQDLGRARIFGTPTAGAALPSQILKLPNGDGFQYAVASYVSRNGKKLEGQGVAPDTIVSHTRASLLDGKDAVIDAAVEWILKEK